MFERQMQEMRELPERVIRLESQVLQIRQEMRDEFSATRSAFRGDLAGRRDDVESGDRRHEHAHASLHEDTLSRIATIGEGRKSRRKR